MTDDKQKMPELLPCPFCGSDDLGASSNEYCSTVICRKCYGCLQRSNADGAFKAWNHRHKPPVDEQRMREKILEVEDFEGDRATDEQVEAWLITELDIQESKANGLNDDHWGKAYARCNAAALRRLIDIYEHYAGNKAGAAWQAEQDKAGVDEKYLHSLVKNEFESMENGDRAEGYTAEGEAWNIINLLRPYLRTPQKPHPVSVAEDVVKQVADALRQWVRSWLGREDVTPKYSDAAHAILVSLTNQASIESVAKALGNSWFNRMQKRFGIPENQRESTILKSMGKFTEDAKAVVKQLTGMDNGKTN